MNRPPHAPPLSTRYHNCVRLAPGISSETGRSEWRKNRGVSRIMRKEVSWRLSTVPCIAVCDLGQLWQLWQLWQPWEPWESGLPVAMTCGPLISASDFWERLEVAAQQAGQPMSECDRVGTMAGCSRLYSTMASHVVARRCVECFGLQSTKEHG